MVFTDYNYLLLPKGHYTQEHGYHIHRPCGSLSTGLVTLDSQLSILWYFSFQFFQGVLLNHFTSCELFSSILSLSISLLQTRVTGTHMGWTLVSTGLSNLVMIY